MAAVLACGPEAALSHRSAGVLWRILPRWSAIPEVTARSDRRKKGIRVHRSPHRQATHPSPAPLTARQLTRALNEAQVLRLVTPAELTTLLTRYPRRRTARPTPERGATRSPLEDRFVAFLKHCKLPLPELNQIVEGHEVDAVYRNQRLIIELDSRQFHTTTHAFETDRDRDPDHLNEGFPTLRITDHRLKHHPSKEAHRLKAILRRRS